MTFQYTNRTETCDNIFLTETHNTKRGEIK